MKKKIIFPIVGTIIVIILFTTSLKEKQVDSEVFHVILADADIYQDGVYTEKFALKKGDYVFRFVPNGDSPQILHIKLDGKEFHLSENFGLNGTIHDSGISKYYTWDYVGQKSFNVKEDMDAVITINPNGNLLGPVSVFIYEN